MKEFFEAVNNYLVINMTVIYSYKGRVFDVHSLNVCDIERKHSNMSTIKEKTA